MVSPLLSVPSLSVFADLGGIYEGCSHAAGCFR